MLVLAPWSVLSPRCGDASLRLVERAHIPDDLSATHQLAGRDGQDRLVRVYRRDTAAVVVDHGVAVGPSCAAITTSSPRIDGRGIGRRAGREACSARSRG